MAKRKSALAAADEGIRFIGTPQDDTIIGSNGDDHLEGRPGSDYIEGLGGNDTILAGADADTIYGGEGDDYIDGGGKGDYIDGGAGADTMIGGNDHDNYVVDNVGDVIIETATSGGGSVHSTISYTLSSYLFGLELEGEENLDGTGNELDNYLSGNSGNNLLIGLGGDDSFYSGGGVDTMIGGTGDDQYQIGDSEGSSIIENAHEGIDWVSLYDWTGDTFTLYDNVENIQMQVFAEHDSFTVNLNDESNQALFYTLPENTSVYAGGGNDTVSMSEGRFVDGGAGNDYIYAGADGMEVRGGAGNDSLDVYAEGSTVYGGSGNDDIYTRYPSTISGGAGQDTISIAESYWDGFNTILDFNGNQDTLRLSDYDRPGLENFRAANFRANATGTAQDANDYLVFNTSTGALYYDGDGNGAEAGVQIANVNVTAGSLGASDFEIIHNS